MKTSSILRTIAVFFSATTLLCGCSQPANPQQTLNTGKQIGIPEVSTTLGGFPVGLTPALDGKFAIVCGMGYRESLYCIATSDARIAGKVDYASIVPKRMKPQTGVEDNSDEASNGKSNGVYYGVAVSGTTVYAAQGAHDSIAVLTLSSSGELTPAESIKTTAGDFPAGLAVDNAGHLLVTNNSASSGATGIGQPATMAIYDTATKKQLGRFTFDNQTHTSSFPLSIAVLSNGSKAYVASERDGCIYVMNTADPMHPTMTGTIATGSHPQGLLLNRDQSTLYVANAQSDTLSMIDTADDVVKNTLLLRPGTSRGLPGVTPTSLAFSPDQKTLYVTLSDMNAVGVVDVASFTLTGMIPAGWYPTGVLETADHHLLVVNAKGNKARNPNRENNPLDRKTGKDPYILNVVHGDVESMPVPKVQELGDLTALVIQQNHLDDLTRQTANPLADIGLKAGKIKHVIYIIKENRTYDQVLGDDARGNGDPIIVIFDKTVTPNQHALADRFVLLDNCYACGEVSGDGWTWSTQSIANDYTQRNIPYNYSGRGRTYDFEGENNGYITGGFPANDQDGKPMSGNPAFKNGAPAIPNVASMEEHLWDRAKEAGITYRNYGFFLSSGSEKTESAGMPAFYPTVVGLRPPGHDLAGITDADFPKL